MPRKKSRTRHRKGQTPITDAVDQSRRMLKEGDNALEWRVHLMGAAGLQETVFVIAHDFDSAEAAASAFATVNDGDCEKYLCERIRRCAGSGCNRELAQPDVRTAKGSGAPTIESALDPKERRWCVSCGAKKFRVGA